MNDSIIATHDVPISEIPRDGVAGRIGEPLQKRSTGRVRSLLSTADYPLFEPPAAWQVREDQGVYIPDFLSDERYHFKQESFSAAEDYAKHLRKAEGLLDEARNLVGLMLAAIGDESDGRAMQTEAGLKAVERKLSKVSNRIDEHDTRYTNLFLAYVDLKEKAEGDESS